MLDLGSEHALFDDVIEAIQNTLTEKHRNTFRQYTDVPSLLEDLKTFCDRNVKDTRRLRVCLERLTVFAHTFAPFFELLSIYVALKPDWVGWYWGTVGLVFEAGSSYVLFLEKVTHIFENLSHVLPNYQQLYEGVKRQLHNAFDDRIYTLMSYVYADVAQLWLDIYHVFSRGSTGVKLRYLRLSSPTLSWRPLDSRLAQLEARLIHHKTWLQGELAVPLRVDYDATRAMYRREYLEFLNQYVEINQNGDAEPMEQRTARRMKRIDKIKAWLSSDCAYRDVYEHHALQRHFNTCNWFLRNEKYCEWKNTFFGNHAENDFDRFEKNWHDRVLFVQANPGFGKTFISDAVIDDLSADAQDLDIDDEYEPPSTAFFHFNAVHSYCTHPSDAFRAMANQLIHTHRHDRLTLDAVSLLSRKTSCHAQASSDDVVAVLSLLLRQHPTFLVIDGIDECSNTDQLLCLLAEICKKSDARVILFSRPAIKIPSEYQKWPSDSPHIVYLSTESNMEDIQAYLSTNLHRMADQGFFGINMDRSLIPKVAERSNGMFLWACLLLKYLQSPDLSPDERQVALQQVHRLEGLNSLYQHILAMLDLRSSQEKQLAANLFRWLALSINRLCVPSLHVATASTPHQVTFEHTSLAEFTRNISSVTCGLVEITDCGVVFTHRSVREYLQSSKLESYTFTLHNELDAHRHLAARCLSFLAHEVPKRPLGKLQSHTRPAPVTIGTSSGTSMRTSRPDDSGYKSMSSASDMRSIITTVFAPAANTLPPVPEQLTTSSKIDYPFLRYASLCWPIHLTRALSHPHYHPPTPTDLPKDLPWLPHLSAFLTDRSAVTTWVEASWRFNLPPNLSRLVPLLDALRSQVPPATIQGRELRWVVHEMRELCDALTELKDMFGTTLRNNPSLIWQWRGKGGAWGCVGDVVGGGGVASGGVEKKSYWPVWDVDTGIVCEALL